MRKGIAIISLFAMMVSFSGCKPILSEKIVEDINENSNFEVNLLTPAEEVPFEGFGIIPGFGQEGYYDKKYGDYDVDYEALVACYVVYTVTSYPDIALGEKYVTEIYITDPEINIYGYSVGDNSEEFSDFLEEKGFREEENNGHFSRCSKGKVKINYGINIETQEIQDIRVRIDTTNLLGVVF